MSLTLQHFGRLVAVKAIAKCKTNRQTMWRCKCECGRMVNVRSGNLTSGHTRSCGCLHKEATIARSLRHGLSRSPEHVVWCSMRNRCTNASLKCYKYYGGRGICVCKRWDSFQRFLEDMGPRPTARHTIERVDNDKGYSPENCKWVTWKEQANNKRPRNFAKAKEKQENQFTPTTEDQLV